jgi:hypothetical protein
LDFGASGCELSFQERLETAEEFARFDPQANRDSGADPPAGDASDSIGGGRQQLHLEWVIGAAVILGTIA